MSDIDWYSFGPFSLDIENSRILKFGQPVRWRSPRRYELLKALIDSRGKVVTYDSLVTQVWRGKDVLNHTVNRTANDLRKRLEGYADCVCNQPGRGFYFKPPPTAVETSNEMALDIESLTDYALALAEWNRRTEHSLQRSLERFRRVLVRHPEFPPALLGLADCLTLLGHAGFPVFPPTQVIPEARAAANKVLAMAQDAATEAAAQVALGKIHLVFDWQFDEAERCFSAARLLDSQQAPLYHALAHLFLITNRWPDSLEAINQARRLGPGAPMIQGTAGWLLYFMGRSKEAVAMCRKTITDHPEFPAGYVMLALACEAEGLYNDALEAFGISNELVPSPVPLAGLGHLYGLTGKRASVARILNQLGRIAETKRVSPYHYALIHVGCGEMEKALDCLEEALGERFDWLIHAGVDPRWAPLRRNRRFKRLLRQIGLPND